MAGKKILIVDDDKDVRMGMALRLKLSGYTVVMAADTISAMSVALKERPDLVLLDVNMPGGNGFMVMERAAELSRPSQWSIQRDQRGRGTPCPIRHRLAN